MAAEIRLRIYKMSIVICIGSLYLFSPTLSSQSTGDILPDIDGWNKSDTIRVFTPQNLYSYIDGAADAYLLQDFERLSVAYYTRSGDTSVTAEIYEHRTEQNAYGIYSQERTSGVEYLQIGIQGYHAETVLNFVIGKSYVKLSSFTLGKNEREMLISIARYIAGNLGGTTDPPAIFRCFPEEGLVPDTYGFTGKNFLGYECFQSAYSAEYRSDSLSFRLFIIDFRNPGQAGIVWKEYLKTAGLPAHMPADGTNTVRDPYHGTITFDVNDNTLCGIIGLVPAEESRNLLKTLQSRVRAYKK